ncbi:hypothetical protein CHLRE_07g335800v5 [Chlamydomonas reinhardtii]|uniref:Potential dynein-preassembly factor n=1 Tax=Chlamydomonas reinhardtii TaxID=3055 RepID=A0A2K3DK73_CHLRE|nr:uncharacterized protein CHLRE_07g335800v5 [Chlamydomonas reinhardtii]PNW80932.1 hypothetical protein CHLRE_07g335800v5 [Chlamydomonas reinhardtii]BBI41243.1 potential dynein-preassembly factor [Chlamydomonas reinhardtii]
MDIGSFTAEFQALTSLLRDPQEEEAAPAPGSVSRPNPGAIGPKDLLNVKVPAPKARHDPKEIWREDELLDPAAAAVDDDYDDGREVPNYEFLYKQAVDTADNFLGMSGKDGSSTSCEDLVVRVELPGAAGAAELDLDVKDTYLKLSSPQYKLSIHLPHKVDGERGKAKWDSTKKVLSITLRIIREEPF